MVHLHTSMANLDASLTSRGRLARKIRSLLWPESDALVRALEGQLRAIEALASAIDLQNLRHQERVNAALEVIEASARRQGRRISDIEQELFLLCRRAAAHEDLAATVQNLLDRLACPDLESSDSDRTGRAGKFVSHADKAE
jgi:hypothetical protein